MGNQEFDFKTLVVYLEKEYSLDREVVVSIIEESIMKAARKNPNFTNDLRISVNRENLSIHVYDTFVVSDDDTGIGFISTAVAKRFNHGIPMNEGDVIEIEIPPSKLGRVCARESKMLIMQKIKNAKNCNIVNSYKNRVGDIVSGVITGIERGDIIFTVNGKTEMVIPKKERIRKENQKLGDHISGVIVYINNKQKHSPVVVSRSDNRFLEELMKKEISEIADGTVEIVTLSRDPGNRAKVVVKTNNKKVDPVGACIGKKGIRINTITKELSGERLDIVRYSDNIIDYVRDAILPAKADSIEVDTIDSNIINVSLSEEQYSTAFGRFGSNVKLASNITNRRIHLKKSVSSMSFEEQIENAVHEMSDILSITETEARQIISSGFLSVDGIASEDEETFIASTGLDVIKGKGIYAAAQAVVSIPHLA